MKSRNWRITLGTEEPKQKLMNQLAITYVQLQLFFKNSVKIKLGFHILILGSNSETQTFLYNTDSVSHDWFISCQCFGFSISKFFNQAQARNEIFILWNRETKSEVKLKTILRVWIEAFKQFLHHQVIDWWQKNWFLSFYEVTKGYIHEK